MNSPASRVGTQFGQYRLDELLGRGGMGEVYKAYDTVRDRDVALKLLHSHLAGDPNFAERFRRESHTVARLDEPHIIPIHDWGEIDGVLYIDMRLVKGRDLREVLKERGTLPPDEAVGIVEQIASALDAAHADGLVHRDVKPENILITEQGFAYLVDFGIAHADSQTHLTQAGTAVGSVAYMAPEQFDNAPITAAIDVYALTSVLFEALTGRVPYPADTLTSAIRKTVMEPPPAPHAVNAAVPAAFDAVIARGMAAEPGDRFASAGELAAAARAALSGIEPVSPTAPTSVFGQQAPPTAYSAPPQAYSAPDATQVAGGSPYADQQYVSDQHYVSGQQTMRASAPHPIGYQTGPQPGYYPPQGYPPQQDDSGKGMIYVLSTLAVVLLLALVGLGVYWFTRDDGTDTAAPETTTPTVTATVEPGPEPDPEPEDTGPAPPPPGSSPCTDLAGVGSDVTSCPFAINVANAYLAAGPKGESRTVRASSPVTGDTYTMRCAPQGDIVVCTGGNNAVVHVY